MQTLFTAICLFLHVGLFAQVPANFSPPDSLITPDSVSHSVKAETSFRNFIRSQIFTDPSRELKIITRSALVLTSASAVGVATYAYGDEPLQEFSTTHHTHFTNQLSHYVKPLGRSGNMLPVSGVIYASGLAFRSPKLQRTGILVASSLIINDFVTGKLKDEFQRRRPNEASHNYYFEGGEGGRHYASFPSAHTSTAFTFAASVATVYKDHKWVPPVAYTTATLVGLSRIHDNQHWATDVLAGAAVGILTAKTTNFLLKQTEKQLEKRKVNIYLAPRYSAGSLGLSVGGTL